MVFGSADDLSLDELLGQHADILARIALIQ